MCSFDGPWFHASYPDAFCVDGYLHDADHDGYDPSDVTHPCPRCNTAEYLKSRAEDAESVEYQSIQLGPYFDEVTGLDIWHRAKAWALQENAEVAAPLIAEIEKTLVPLVPGQSGRDADQSSAQSSPVCHDRGE
jgi:hypothetical protein